MASHPERADYHKWLKTKIPTSGYVSMSHSASEAVIARAIKRVEELNAKEAKEKP